MKLRKYQEEILSQLLVSDRNDLVQLDTGAGKTIIEAALAKQYEYTMLLAHRNILIIQMSDKLARFNLQHDTISTEHTRRRCVAAHLQHGESCIKRGMTNRLAVSVDSLMSAEKRDSLSINMQAPWVIIVDEAHHVLPDNKWGHLQELFPNARFVGFTATPARLDGESLHISNGGVFERLVQAESLQNNSVQQLIAAGYLARPVVWAPLQKPKKAKGRRNLWIHGDPVEFYCKNFRKKRACMFCPSILNSKEFAEEFRNAGAPAAHIGSDLSAVENARILDAFACGEIHVLTNVDMVSEGFDLPDIEVLILAKKTSSFPAFRQWCGRVLRPSPGKKEAHIVDHCGNVVEHGMPDDPVIWDIERPPRGLGKLKQIPCPSCGFFYKVREKECPACGQKNPFLTGEALGSHYVYIVKQLDSEFLRQAREQYYEEKYQERLNSELIWQEYDTHGLLARQIQKLREWFAQSLIDSGVTYADVNIFLKSKDCKYKDFWIENFTIKDIDSSDGKAIEVYNKWKQQ